MLLSDSFRKARKNHKCDWCCCDIQKDTKYYIQTNKTNDNFYTWKSHTKCLELTKKLNMFEDCDELSDCDFYEYVKNFCEKNNIKRNKFKNNYENVEFLKDIFFYE